MIHPIVLCGGPGTRLWPSSRQSFPKQFAPLMDGTSPFQQILGHLSGEGFAAPLVATHSDFRYLATDQAQAAGVWDSTVLVEPECHGTAASVLSAALTAEDNPETLFLIISATHVAADATAFRAAVLDAVDDVRKGKIVMFPVAERDVANLSTSRARTAVSGARSAALRVLPDPDEENAAHRHDRCADTGVVLMRRADLLAAFDTKSPELVENCRRAVSGGTAEPGAFLYDASAYSQTPELGFVSDILGPAMPRSTQADRAKCSDLDDWDAVWSLSPRDTDGVATSGEVLAVNCRNTLLRSDDGAIQVLGLGLKNVVAVAMRDAVLIADRDELHELPAAVARLQTQRKTQATEYPRYHRPWGWYESLIASDRFQVKRIMVKPGGVLSLQSHVHRSEHWIVVSGTAEVTVGDEVSLVTENGSVYIPLGAVHRMANPGKLPMYLIEVQTGSYLGEDDIRRYEDIYSRC